MTLPSPDSQYRNQIDYVLCSQRWKSSIQSAKTRHRADCGSDHQLLTASCRLKLKKVGKTTRPFSLKQILYDYTVVVQLLTGVWLFVTPWTATHQASLSFTVSMSLLKLISIESVMPSNHLIFCHSLLLLHSVLPRIRVFSSESSLRIRCPKYWSFSFNTSLSGEYSGLIFSGIDWFGLLAVQGTVKSLLQHHSSKASVLWHSAFLTVQLSNLYMTTGKTIALTTQILVGKVMSLLFNILSRFVKRSCSVMCSYLQYHGL